MKTARKFLTLLCALALILSAIPAAFAAEESAEDAADGGSESAEDWQYAGMSLDEIMQALLTEYGTDAEHVNAGYLNLVTGEEYYLNADTEGDAASMYKVPLNMLVTELINSGELDWDSRYTDVSYEYVRTETIVNSSNDWANFLWTAVGSYAAYRTGIAEYMGLSEDEIDANWLYYNNFTPRQVIHCLKLLYDEQERFPDIIETMQQAEPEHYFKLKESRFDIAHKYGYNSETYTYMNDSAIAFTDEPIAIVMFTKSVPRSEQLLTAYCTAMCDYTQYQAAIHQQEAEAAALEAIESEKPESIVSPSPYPTAAPESAESGSEENDSEVQPMKILICFAVIIVAAAICIVLAFTRARARGIKPFWMAMSVLVAAAGLMLCAAGASVGTLYAKPDGDPGETAEAFLSALTAGDYTTAYSYLRDYSSLGLETPPESEAGQLVYDALTQSYGYELSGECRVDKLSAVQKLSFTYLNLQSMDADIEAKTEEELESLVEDLPRSQIYDDNNQYLPEVTDEAYLNALKDILSDAEKYYTSEELELSLVYEDGRWQVLAGSELLKALNGGASY